MVKNTKYIYFLIYTLLTLPNHTLPDLTLPNSTQLYPTYTNPSYNLTQLLAIFWENNKIPTCSFDLMMLAIFLQPFKRLSLSIVIHYFH